MKISSRDKVLFPGVGVTKGELADYYAMVADLVVPHVAGRPITMERFPKGIGEDGFFHKDVTKGFPAWLERVEVPKTGGTVHHPVVRDARALLWLANQNCITPHVWTSRTPDLFRPDLCVFDLDPTEDERPDVLRAAVLALRGLLDELGLPSWIKTTGSKGFHVVVPLDVKAGFDRVGAFAHGVGRVLVARDPDHLTQEFAKADRGGRILVDTGRNGWSATFAAAWAVRARPGATVSAPCTWEEVESGEVGPRTFTLRDMERRIAAAGDPWADMDGAARSLDGAIERLRPMLGGSA